MKYIWYCKTKIGQLRFVETDGIISHLQFDGDESLSDYKLKETTAIKTAESQLFEYFDGKRKEFDFPLLLQGTTFQKTVWNALRTIPFGKTCSYKDIAQQIGSPKAARAVGMANNRNPIPIIIPCHRVVGANGSLTGYAGGLEIKKNLLNLEGCYD